VLGNLARLQRSFSLFGRSFPPTLSRRICRPWTRPGTACPIFRSALRGFRLPQSADAARLDDLNAKLALIQS